MKKRTAIDLTLILVLCGFGSYLAYRYLGENKAQIKPAIMLKEAGTAISDQKTEELVINTGASDSEDSWYPATLSNRWKYIEIHQSGLLSGNSATLAKRSAANIQNNDSGFHFVITNGYGGADGKVEVTPRWETQQDSSANPLQTPPGSTSNNAPHESISICLIGDFTVQAPTSRQIASLKGLLNYLLVSTTVKSFNISFNAPTTSQPHTPPELFPLDLIIKTRTSK